jgi:acyl transferase domain-containing protein
MICVTDHTLGLPELAVTADTACSSSLAAIHFSALERHTETTAAAVPSRSGFVL